MTSKKKFDSTATAYSRLATNLFGKRKKSTTKARKIGKSKILGMGYGMSAGRKKRSKKDSDKIEVPVGEPFNPEVAAAERGEEVKDTMETQVTLSDRAKEMQGFKLQMVWTAEVQPKTTPITIGALPSTRIWETNDGREMQVKDMTDTHLLNALFKLKRTAIKKHLEFIDKTNERSFSGVASVFENTEELAAKTDIATGTSWKSFVSGDYFALYLEAERRTTEGANLRPYLSRLVGTNAVRMAQ